MMARSDSCATSSVSAPSALRQLSAAPRRQLGRDGGVVCWQWLCSRQLPAALGPQGPQLATSAAGYRSGPDLDQLLHLAAQPLAVAS